MPGRNHHKAVKAAAATASKERGHRLLVVGAAATALAAVVISGVAAASSGPEMPKPSHAASVKDSVVVPVSSPLQAVLSSLPVCSHDDIHSSAQVIFESANGYKGRGAKLDALACYRRAIELDRHHSGSYNNMGNVLRHLEPNSALSCGASACSVDALRAAAAQSLQTVIGINPRHANAYINLAALLRSRGQIEESLATSRTALAFEPRHVMGLENFGRALQAHSAPAKAPVSDAERQLLVHTEAGGWRKGSALDEAIGAYSSIISLLGVRASANAWRGLGYTLMWRGRVAEGRDVLRRALGSGVWSVEHQYPGELRAGLGSAAFPDLSRCGCIKRILQSHAAAAAESTQQLLRLHEELRESHGGAWGDGLFTVEHEGLNSPELGFGYYDVARACQAPPAGQPKVDGADLATPLCNLLDEIYRTTNARIQVRPPSDHPSIHTYIRTQAHSPSDLRLTYGSLPPLLASGVVHPCTPAP